MLDYRINLWEKNIQDNFESLIVIAELFDFKVERQDIYSVFANSKDFKFLFKKNNKSFAMEFILYKDKIEYIKIIKRSSEEIMYELQQFIFRAKKFNDAIEFAKSLII